MFRWPMLSAGQSYPAQPQGSAMSALVPVLVLAGHMLALLWFTCARKTKVI